MISEGDVLNLRIVEVEKNEFKLQIINMYGKERRVLDDELFVSMHNLMYYTYNINYYIYTLDYLLSTRPYLVII